MKIGMSTKVIVLFLIAGLVPLGIFGFVSQRTANKALKEQAFNQLISIRETKKEQVEEYFSNIEKQVKVYSKDGMIINAMEEFKTAFNAFRQENEIDDAQLNEYRSELEKYYTGNFSRKYESQNNGRSPDTDKLISQLDDESVLLQYFYIKPNDYVLGENNKLDYANDRSTYSNHHSYYHPIIREFQEQFGFYDIFLVDPDNGRIVYSVFKEVDFATSLIDGPYSDTNLGKVFREANNSTNPEFVELVDFSQYTPSYESAASFIASPIFDGQRKIGVLIFQMPIDRINMVMTSNNNWKSSGLGESGKTYIIGSDYTMRSQSRFLIEDKEGYHAQMEGLGMSESLLNIIKAKDSTILLQKIETKGAHAAISGEANVEIFPDYRHIPVLSAYAPLGIKGVNWAIMAEIDKEEALRAATTLGKQMMMISAALLVLIIGLSILVLRITGRATNVIKKMVESLTNYSGQVSDASEQISSSSQTHAEGASEQASSLEETSSSMEEMSSMTKQNAQNAEEASKLVDVCTTEAEDSNKAAEEVTNAMEEITASSKKIAEITKVINGIASQTNTLALKAGMDTAQVIKQGNSFAEVAEEVKNLANKSMDAAKDTEAMVGDCIANVDEAISDASMYKEFKKNINKIAEGIKVMDDMALHTNTLALQVEKDTVQVIERGNSFAATAKEIKNLSQKNMITASDTKALIEDCISGVYKLVTDTNKDEDNAVNVANKYKEFKRNMNKIAEGIKAMDDMSSQTHTLVHKVTEGAVRVIEQGNSFDAVAKKVRNLSQKSMAAVKNTKSSTEYCITKSDEAVNNANKYEHYKENTEKIVMGINDIETIAYQTNLLALNAEEGAARSSDNGEKFAAVTEEVSSLAKKTTDAAKDITTLIGECIKKAGNGIRVANKCKDSTENIVMDVKKASILTKEITEASKEQSEGINQVGKAIQQIDVVTQQNAANAEETASASEELAEQALTMKEQIEILSTQVSDKTTEDEASNQAPEQPSRDEKTLEKAATKLLSPIAKLLKPMLIRLHNLESNHSNKGIISESMGSSETTPDVDNKAEGGNGNKEDVLVETASNESIIPMDENRIPEHKEGFSDF